QNTPYQVTPSTWYGVFSISSLLFDNARKQFNFTVVVQRTADNLYPDIVHVEIVADHRQRRPRNVHTIINELELDPVIRKLGSVHPTATLAEDHCSYLQIGRAHV